MVIIAPLSLHNNPNLQSLTFFFILLKSLKPLLNEHNKMARFQSTDSAGLPNGESENNFGDTPQHPDGRDDSDNDDSDSEMDRTGPEQGR